MGEIADMFLDGTLCQVCGTVVKTNNPTREELSPGFPRTCTCCVKEQIAEHNAEACPECGGTINGVILQDIRECDTCRFWYPIA